MKIKELRIDISFTKNLGNYQNIKISEGLTIEIEDQSKIEEVRQQTYESIKNSINEKLKKTEKHK